MKAKFQSKGKLSFKTNYPIRADQFSGVSIAVKASKTCINCIYFDGYDLQKNLNLTISTANKWTKFRFDFESMGIENNQFNGIVLYYYKTNSQPFELYIGSIDLIGKKIKPDTGVCLYIPFSGNEGSEGEEGGDIPGYIPQDEDNDKTDISTTTQDNNNSSSTETDEPTDIQTDSITEIVSEIPANNSTPLAYVNILSIKQINPLIINIQCENFTKLGNENMIFNG